jgi:UDP-N-acetylglucosamine--N-acetylmuramyl-(pentapeptide) pyrophosphoryl-undecaprenol N-acetylglucosamine transferase
VARLARRAFVNFAEAARVFGPAKTIQTGIPVRAEFFSIAPKQHTPPYTVLIFGGSQGARSLNRAVVEALPRLAQAAEFRDRPVRLVMQTGQSEYNRVREAVEKFPGPSPACRHEAFVFMDRMWETFAQADLIVCRAGATTVAELAAAGRAAVLVPYPAAANQHQLRNAEALVKLGAARLLLDQDLSGARLAEVLAELLSDTAKLAAIESAIRHEARPNACGHIVDELEKLVARK